MGMIDGIFKLLFGNGSNVVAETAEVFRENKEAGAGRDAAFRQAVLKEFAAEFARERSGWFDRLMDGVNRLPRPALALGTLGLFVMAMHDPLWFSARMQGLALVPEPLWWLMGVIVSFYFGARHQLKSHEFQRSIAATMARAPDVMRSLAELQTMAEDPVIVSNKTQKDAADFVAHKPENDSSKPYEVDLSNNAALLEWHLSRTASR